MTLCWHCARDRTPDASPDHCKCWDGSPPAERVYVEGIAEFDRRAQASTAPVDPEGWIDRWPARAADALRRRWRR